MTLSRKLQPPRREPKQIAYTPKPRVAVRGPGLLALVESLPTLQPGKAEATDAAGQRHLSRVAALGCILCRLLGHGFTAPQIHHLREGQGGAQRASDFISVGLCEPHHTGSQGLHGLGTRGFERRYGIDELGLLAEVIARLTIPGADAPATTEHA